MLPLYSKTSSFRAAEGAKALLFGRAARQSKRSPSESHYKVFLLLFIAAICLVVAPHVSRMITKVDAQLAQPRSGATKAFAAAPVCCKGCSKTSSCCCSPHDKIPLTITSYRTAIRTVTVTKKSALRAREFLAPPPIQDAVPTKLHRRSKSPPLVPYIDDDARNLCLKCPAGVKLGAANVKGVHFCCPARKTFTRVRVRSWVKTVTKTQSAAAKVTIAGQLFYDNNNDGKYTNPPDVPLANTRIFLVSNTLPKGRLQARALTVLAKTTTNSNGNFTFVVNSTQLPSPSSSSTTNKTLTITSESNPNTTLATISANATQGGTVAVLLGGVQVTRPENITISPPVVLSGSKVTVTGTGTPGLTAILFSDGIIVGRVNVSANGSFTVTSSDLAPGAHVLQVLQETSLGAQSDKVSAGQVTVFGSTTTTNLGKSTSAPGSTKITPSSILGGATTGVTLNFQASLSSTAAPAITTTAGPAITTLDITTSSATPSSTSESQTPSSTSATETASSTSESQTQTLSSTTATETLSSTSLTSSTLTATSTTATCRTPGVMTTAKAFDGYPINMVDYVPDLQGNAYLISMTSGQVLRQEAGYQVPALGVFATVNQALQYKGMTIDANNEIWILDSTWGYTHVRANGSTSYFGFNKVGASNSSSSWTMIPYNFNKVHYDVVNNKIYAIAADQGGPPLPYVFRFDPTTGLTDVLANSSDFSVRSGWTWPPDNYPRAMALDYNNGYIYVGSEGPRIRRLSTSASQGSHTFVNITMPSTAVVASTGFAMAVGTTNGHLYACFPFTSIQRTLCYEWSSVGASGSPTLISNYTYNDIDTQASLRVSSDRVYFMNSNLNVKAQTAPIDDWNNWKDAVDAGIFVTSPDMVPYGADAVFVFGPGLTANGGNYSLHMFKLDSRYKWGMYAVNINSQAVTAGMAAGSGAADPTRGYLYWVHNSDIVRYDVNNVSAVTTTTVVSGLSSINKLAVGPTGDLFALYNNSFVGRLPGGTGSLQTIISNVTIDANRPDINSTVPVVYDIGVDFSGYLFVSVAGYNWKSGAPGQTVNATVLRADPGNSWQMSAFASINPNTTNLKVAQTFSDLTSIVYAKMIVTDQFLYLPELSTSAACSACWLSSSTSIHSPTSVNGTSGMTSSLGYAAYGSRVFGKVPGNSNALLTLCT